jgi:hypothetical protein
LAESIILSHYLNKNSIVQQAQWRAAIAAMGVNQALVDGLSAKRYCYQLDRLTQQ